MSGGPGMYTVGKTGMMNGTIDLDTDDIRCRLCADGYAFNAADASMTPVTKVTDSVDQALANESVTAGVFDADNPAFPAVAAGDNFDGFCIYKFNTNDADSVPIFYGALTSTPTNGSPVTVNFDDGANKVFALGG